MEDRSGWIIIEIKMPIELIGDVLEYSVKQMNKIKTALESVK